MSTQRTRLFLAAPFTSALSSVEGSIFLSELRRLMERLREAGFRVFSAHDDERWGNKLLEPLEALIRDLSEIERSDVVIAIFNNIPSPGTVSEVTHAITSGRRLLILKNTELELPYLFRTLEKIPHVRMVNFHPGTALVHLMRWILEYVDDLLKVEPYPLLCHATEGALGAA